MRQRFARDNCSARANGCRLRRRCTCAQPTAIIRFVLHALRCRHPPWRVRRSSACRRRWWCGSPPPSSSPISAAGSASTLAPALVAVSALRGGSDGVDQSCGPTIAPREPSAFDLGVGRRGRGRHSGGVVRRGVAHAASSRGCLGSHPSPDAGRRARAHAAPRGRRRQRSGARRDGALHAGAAPADRRRRIALRGGRVSNRIPVAGADDRAEGRVRVPDRATTSLAGVRGRVPLAIAAVGLVLFAPHAYSVDGFLQAGFFAQVASELFVVAGWWALARWWMAPAPGVDGVRRLDGRRGVPRLADLDRAADGGGRDGDPDEARDDDDSASDVVADGDAAVRGRGRAAPLAARRLVEDGGHQRRRAGVRGGSHRRGADRARDARARRLVAKRQTARVTLWFLMGVVASGGRPVSARALARRRDAVHGDEDDLSRGVSRRDPCRRRARRRARAGSGALGRRRLGGHARGAGGRAARGDVGAGAAADRVRRSRRRGPLGAREPAARRASITWCAMPSRPTGCTWR